MHLEADFLSELWVERVKLCDVLCGRFLRGHAAQALDLALRVEELGAPPAVVAAELDRAAHMEWVAGRAEQGQILWGCRHNREGQMPEDFDARPSKITHVAVRFEGKLYSLPAPHRHHDVIAEIAALTGARYVDARDDDQGFLDASGRYLTRKQALRVAIACRQLKLGVAVVQGRLFSENVW